MKSAFASLTLAVAALAHPALAQENAQVRTFLATQMSAAVSEARIEVEDEDGAARITAIETGNCRATVRAGQKSWTIDWRAADGVEDMKDEGFFFVHDENQLAFLADANDSRAAAALDKLYRAMDRAWNLCE
jgi:hypothetical protein